MTQITNLSQFKKALKVGALLNCTWHTKFAGRREDGSPIWTDEERPVREVSIVQTNSFALRTVKADGTIVDSWCAYPKASECEFVDNKCIIYEEDRLNNVARRKVLTYSFVENDPVECDCNYQEEGLSNHWSNCAIHKGPQEAAERAGILYMPGCN